MNPILIPDYQELPPGSQLLFEFNDQIYANAIYLHGTLEKLAGFDILYNLECNRAPIKLNQPSPIDVDILIYPIGKSPSVHKAKFYFWLTSENWLKGLVVSPDDTQSVDYATKCQQQNKSFL